METKPENVTIELCKSNSIGSNYYTPRIVEVITCTREEADELLSKKMVNGFYYREA